VRDETGVTNPVDEFEVGSVGVPEARQLRDAVLRAGLDPGGSVYPGDDEPDTLHLGAFAGHCLVAVATVCREAPPRSGLDAAWRLRGMATDPEWQGQGLGKRLALACIAYSRERGASMVWCSSRLESIGFYSRLGFVVVGESYGLPQFSDRMYVEMHLSV